MNRRKFLGNTALFSVPLMLKGIPVFAGHGALHPFLQALAGPTYSCDKILVVIQMNGGNDGLNMVIPLDKYSELSNARSGLLIPEAAVLPLSGSVTTGLHPSMTGIRDLFNGGKINIVQGVCYPNPNFSHFQAQDIWFTASNSNQTLTTGWLGRDLNEAFPGFPVGYPNVNDPDPLAIQIGGALPLSLQGPNINMGYNAPNPAALISVATATPSPAPYSDYGTELTFLRMMKDQSNAYTSRITTAYNAQATLSTQYPATGNTLSDQLKIVARLIGGGLKTPVYIVNHPDSFDTHVDQVVAGNTTTGWHANILSKLSVAISAFQNDITLMGKSDKVTGMTFSEFGRRVISNASSGTDHGSAAPVIFFGAGVNGGIIGTSPVLPATPTGSTQVPTQYDFRQLYASVMEKWLCMTTAQSQTVLNGTFPTLPIFAPIIIVPLSGIELSAIWENNFARLQFQVYENDNYDYFVIERSQNGINFHPINNVLNTTAGNFQAYTYRDDRNVEMYYRVKGITRQGEKIFSEIVKLPDGSESNQLKVYPVPVTNYIINIEFNHVINENVDVNIYGIRGERLYYNQFPGGNKLLRFKVPPMFINHTIYVLKITFGNEVVSEKIFFE